MPVLFVNTRTVKNMGRYFSIQMKSKTTLDKIILNDSSHGILIEGDLGELSELSILEEKLLEIQFTNGVLRLEINRPELLRATEKSISEQER